MENYFGWFLFLIITFIFIAILPYIISFIIKILIWQYIKNSSINTKNLLKRLLDIYQDFSLKIDSFSLNKKIIKLKKQLDSNKNLNFIAQHELFLVCYDLLFSNDNDDALAFKHIIDTKYPDFKSLNHQIANMFRDLIQIKSSKYSLFEIKYIINAYVRDINNDINEIMKIIICTIMAE